MSRVRPGPCADRTHRQWQADLLTGPCGVGGPCPAALAHGSPSLRMATLQGLQTPAQPPTPLVTQALHCVDTAGRPQEHALILDPGRRPCVLGVPRQGAGGEEPRRTAVPRAREPGGVLTIPVSGPSPPEIHGHRRRHSATEDQPLAGSWKVTAQAESDPKRAPRALVWEQGGGPGSSRAWKQLRCGEPASARSGEPSLPKTRSSPEETLESSRERCGSRRGDGHPPSPWGTPRDPSEAHPPMSMKPVETTWPPLAQARRHVTPGH